MNSYAPRPIASPCIKICEMDTQSKLCTGCFRTIDEIAYWSTMGNLARDKVMREIEARRIAATPN
jgi:uncharacterized protein